MLGGDGLKERDFERTRVRDSGFSRGESPRELLAF